LKRILILGAGVEQSIAIKQAKKLGYFVIACDQDKKAYGFQYSDKAIVLNIKNVEDILKVAIELEIDGVFSHAVEIPYVVSEIAEKLDLPGLSVKVANLATNKINRIRFFQENNIPCANFVVAKSELELESVAKKIGFPLILKPVDSAGSRGVQLVENLKTLKDAYKNAIKYSESSEVLLEEVLSGPEVSTESVVYDNKIYTFAFADRNYKDSKHLMPFFIEDGINYPSILSKDIQKKIYLLVEKTIKVLGIDFGAAKGDIIIDNGTPKVIEMAARTSGGWFGAGSIPAATGCNALVPLIQMSVGDNPELDFLKPIKNLGCAQRYVIPKIKGKVIDVSGDNFAKNSEGVVMSDFFLPKVGEIIKPAESHADRFGQLICTAATRDEAIHLCESAISKVKIVVDRNV